MGLFLESHLAGDSDEVASVMRDMIFDGRLNAGERINEVHLAASTNAQQAIKLDDSWHFTLWEKCQNPVLISLIEQFIRRTRPYRQKCLIWHGWHGCRHPRKAVGRLPTLPIDFGDRPAY